MSKKICKYMVIMIGAYVTSVLQGSYIQNQYYDWVVLNFLQAGNNLQKAQQLYSKIFSKENFSPYFYGCYFIYLYKQGKHQEIINLLAKIENKLTITAELELIFVHTLKKLRQPIQAYKRLVKASNQFPYHQQIIFETASAMIAQKELKNAINIIDKLLNNTPKQRNYFVLYFLKAQSNAQLHRYNDARKNIKECLDIYPKFDKGLLLYAFLQEQDENFKKATEGYQKYLANHLELTGRTDQKIAAYLMQLVIKQKKIEQTKGQIFFTTSHFKKSLIFFKQKKYKPALNQINQYIAQNSYNIRAKLFKIQILISMKQFNNAVAQLRAWIKKDPINPVWFKTLHLLIRIGAQPNTIIKTFEAIERDHPNTPFAQLYLADLYIRFKNRVKAIEYLNKIVNKITNATVRTKIFFQLGMLYFEQQAYNKMRTALEQGQSLGINFPPLENLLAYYYATKGKNFEKAQMFIEKALAQDKQNPHFLDTQAVIFYKQGAYTKAQELLASLAKQQPHDATILLHLAKTEYKQGNLSKAHEIAQQARLYVQSEYEIHKIKKLEKYLIAK